MKLSTKIAYNTIVQFVSKFISTIFGLIAIAIMTIYLGQAGFGKYTTIITFLSFFAVIADLGLTLVTVQLISRPETDEKTMLNNLFGIRLVTALFFLGLAPIVVLFLPYDPITKIGVAITAVSFLFTALNQIMVGLFQKRLRMDKISIAEIASRFSLIIFIIIAAKLDQGLLGIMTATVLSNFLSFAIHYYYSRKYAKIKFAYNKKVWLLIFSKSWPLAITIVFNLIYLKTDTLILSLIKSPSEVGIYGATYKVLDVLVTVPFMFAGIVLPLLTQNWLENNKEKFTKMLQKSFDFMAILSIPAVIGVQFLGEPIMVLVAGKEFAESGNVLKILIVALVFIFLGCILSHAIIALDKQKKIIPAYFFTSLTSLAIYFWAIPKHSYFGAAWGTLYSELIICLAAGYYVWKYSGFIPNSKVIIKSLIASLVMGIYLHYLPNQLTSANYLMIFSLTSSALIYFVLLYILKGVTKKDIDIILNR